MDKPLFTLKPNVINALFPLVMKNLLYFSIVSIIFSLSRNLFSPISYINDNKFWIFFALALIFLIPLLIKIIILYNIKYYFYKTHVVYEFEFIYIKKLSLPYHQIANISTKISLWDRLCNAGDIILYTPEDVGPNLVLQFIKEPHKIEKMIYQLTHFARK